jgi:hypothetical protein
MTALTDEEWDNIHGLFPHLVRAETLRTALESPDYNCFGFALGKNEWVEPPKMIDGFKAFCELFPKHAEVLHY